MPGRIGVRCRVAGHELTVPRGMAHPLADGGASFYYRIVGPMIAPGQRVLVADCGVGLGALVVGSRGAKVLALDPDPAAVEATRGNVRAAGLEQAVEVRVAWKEDVADEGPFDLVLLAGGGCAGDRLPGLVGEQGRLVRLAACGSPPCLLPDGYRAVQLARSPGLFAPFAVFSVGWDLERARAARHRARGSDDDRRRAQVSRRRWQGPSEPPDVATSDAPTRAETPSP